MGSFRSQPDLVKHSISKTGFGNISYAATHMCGKTSAIQVGASTWRMHISTSHPLATQKIRSSESLMATEVCVYAFRSRSFDLCREALHRFIRIEYQLPCWQI